jgi:hypothetical protein
MVLAGLIALRKECHNTQHVGRAPDLDQVMEALMPINGWTREKPGTISDARTRDSSCSTTSRSTSTRHYSSGRVPPRSF